MLTTVLILVRIPIAYFLGKRQLAKKPRLSPKVVWAFYCLPPTLSVISSEPAIPNSLGLLFGLLASFLLSREVHS